MKTQRKCSPMFFSLLLMVFVFAGVAPLVSAQTQEEVEPVCSDWINQRLSLGPGV